VHEVMAPLVRRLLSVTLAVSTVLCALDARADGDALDTVFTKGGGRLRGTVAQEDPTAGVIIKLADGTIRTVTPADVLRVEYAHEVARPIVPAPKVEAAPAPAGILVTLESNDESVTLDKVTSSAAFVGSNGRVAVTGSAQEWETQCRVPCGKRLDPNATYQVTGDGLWSHEFGLGTKDPVTVTVKMAPRGPFLAGLTLLCVGMAGTVAGGAVLAGGLAGPDTTSTIGGAVSAAAGVVILIPAIILLTRPGTTVTTDDGRKLSLSVRPRPLVEVTPQGFVF